MAEIDTHCWSQGTYYIYIPHSKYSTTHSTRHSQPAPIPSRLHQSKRTQTIFTYKCIPKSIYTRIPTTPYRKRQVFSIPDLFYSENQQHHHIIVLNILCVLQWYSTSICRSRQQNVLSIWLEYAVRGLGIQQMVTMPVLLIPPICHHQQ